MILDPYFWSTRETSSRTGFSSSTSKMVSVPPRMVICVVGFSALACGGADENDVASGVAVLRLLERLAQHLGGSGLD